MLIEQAAGQLHAFVFGAIYMAAAWLCPVLAIRYLIRNASASALLGLVLGAVGAVFFTVLMLLNWGLFGIVPAAVVWAAAAIANKDRIFAPR